MFWQRLAGRHREWFSGYVDVSADGHGFASGWLVVFGSRELVVILGHLSFLLVCLVLFASKLIFLVHISQVTKFVIIIILLLLLLLTLSLLSPLVAVVVGVS